VARACRDVAYLAESITQFGNSNAVTDAAAAGLMARAAVQTAALNVKINARGLQNPHLALAWQQEVASLEAEVAALAGSIIAIAAERGGF
jgi:formiminotetrahydrofolate cyclodeaminase